MIRTVEKFNIFDPDHAGFMYDLAKACETEFLNDHMNDIVLLMMHYQNRLESGEVKAFLAKVDGKKAGIIWVEFDPYGVGRLRAGLMPEYRKGWTAYYFLSKFIEHCFNKLEIRKLDAEIVLYGSHNRASKAAEKLLRRFGFRKEGILKEALIINGKARGTVLLGLTRNQYEGLKNHV